MGPMAVDLYSKLSDIDLLRRAWHLARDDSRTDFMFDVYRFADFAINLDDHLRGIAHSLSSGTYHPKPLFSIDVPKSTLSVRPGSVLQIEDKIVLWAITCLIAPTLDKQLSDGVYSWRVKRDSKGKELFHVFEEHEILKFPFLKRSTIHKRISFVEPWYNAWPRFIEDLEYAYEKEGYKYLVLSDIAAYFENIDLNLLRDLILQYLPNQQRTVNFLISLLKYWAWPALYGATVPRGIPQGNGVSSFLGNIYLLPLDRAILKFGRKYDLKYLRYMDDTKVLAKDHASALQALFEMNRELRGLQLNIQGAKTRILEGEELREEFIDDRLVAVNQIIGKIKSKPVVSPTERKTYISELKSRLRLVEGKKKVIQDKELRLFRRILTGYTLLRHSGMVSIVLDQLQRNPDARLLNSAVRYLRVQDRNVKRISDRLVAFLTKTPILFAYQAALFWMALRFTRSIPLSGWNQARKKANSKKAHWYVRQQAILLLGMRKVDAAQLLAFKTAFREESEPPVKKAWTHVLSQLPRDQLEQLARQLMFEPDYHLQRVGRFYVTLLVDSVKGFERANNLFNQLTEDILIERFYEIEALSKADDLRVRQKIFKGLKEYYRKIKRPLIKERAQAILDSLSTTPSSSGSV